MDYRLLAVVYRLYDLYLYIDDYTVFVLAENPEIAFGADWVYSIYKQTMVACKK